MTTTNQTISDVLITQYGDTMFKLASQTMARTRGVARLEELHAEDKMLNRVGTFEVQDLTARSPRVKASDIGFDRRRLTAGRFGVAAWIDRWDIDRMLTDPQSVIAQRSIEALERKFDQIFLQALTATVMTGRDGTNPLTATADGVVTVDATGGFIYETLLQISANFQSKEVGTNDMGQTTIRKVLFISEQEHQQLMKEGELINRDFTNQMVIDKGYITRVLDFDVVIFGSKVANPMLQVTNGVRGCFCVATDGVSVGLQKNWDVRIADIDAEVWDTVQIQASGRLGAVRMEGARIQQINTTAS